MFGTRIIIKKGAKEEAEKPFWISYSDMMTALMVLFLVVMSTALFGLTKEVDKEAREEKEREKEIESLLREIKQAEEKYPGMLVNIKERTIDFGPKAYFKVDEHAITRDTASRIRSFVRNELLPKIHRPEAKDWLKRVVVEGYTDISGTYLYNLNLSLNRSHSVLCVLLEQRKSGPNRLTRVEQAEVRSLFLVGGYSFNSAQDTLEKSRRVTLRLEFLRLGEEREKTVLNRKGDTGKCQLT